MLKYFSLPLCFMLASFGYSQDRGGAQEKFPVFPKCAGVPFVEEESCFRNTLQERVMENFELPQKVLDDEYSGEITVLFEVTREGEFKILLVEFVNPELEREMQRAFSVLPVVQPATYGGRPFSMQFRMVVKVPLEQEGSGAEKLERSTLVEITSPQSEVLREYDSMKSRKFQNPRATSQIIIPFSHEYYSRFDDEVNRVGTNFHSASKPYLFEEVALYYDFEYEKMRLYKEKYSWFGQKFWNEHLFVFQGENYWFAADFGLDLQLGKDLNSGLGTTFNNTRAAIFQGGLGNYFNFYTVVYENQGRFADYFNRYAESIKPDGGNPAIIPGRGIAKPIYGDAYDYPVAEGYVSYGPGEFFNVQFGHGKNFIGDGYRSLLLSDNAAPYPYLKLNTAFWKIKYTNTWMSLRDVRPEVTGDGSFRTKYMANHYLSLNVTKRLNLGFFESVMWENDNDRGFDLNYLNPVIFYRAIEFSTGGRAGNAIMGLTAKYKWSSAFNMYGQFLIDEFSGADVMRGEKSWKNKLGFQVGVKYFNALNIPNLLLQLEYNQVRPYAYSHNTITLNYGHSNQSMAHLWGANFRELVAIGRYKKDRYYGSFKLIYGKRGFDFNNVENGMAYGGDIYRSEEDRPFETGVEIGQGNTALSFFTEGELGYIVNPSTNLKLFGSLIYRDMNPEMDTGQNFEDSTLWLNFGIRTDIFNWYFDY